MAWLWGGAAPGGRAAPLAAAFSPKLCFTASAGGALVPCDGSPSQAWTRRPGGLLESGSGLGCLSNGGPRGGAPRSLAFAVAALGWRTATAEDLWTGAKQTGAQLVADVAAGDGASQVFRLSKAS